jgi:hypothetical protein
MGHGFTTDGGWFIDPHGRHTLLRGVNLGGSTKVPFSPNGATHLRPDLTAWRDVSFVGRPAPLDEVDEHLDRIAHWGFNVLRFLTTWEAIEHAGPGEYDEAYLDYAAEVIRRAGARGLLVFVDPHQDVWSRWTGGDGAPYWCFEGVGLLAERFEAAGAVELDGFDWPANYNRAPTATMWTLFFGGDAFAPDLGGVQDWLQSHYIDAVAQLAERVRDQDHVLGYDSLNEPSNGYLGRGDDLLRGGRTFDRGDQALKPFSPVEHLAAADGVTVTHDDGGVLNPDGVRIWRDGCPWRAAGVWDLDADGVPVLSDPAYFTQVDGLAIRPFADFVVPFIDRFRRRIREVHPDAIVFIEGSPMEGDLEWIDPDPLVCNARHWYDISLLMTRRFDPDHYEPWFSETPLSGAKEIGAQYAIQLGDYAAHSVSSMSDRPLLLGEFGVTYEMNGGEAYRSGDFRAQRISAEAQYDALDATLIHSTQWNYTADNSHDHGDQWNAEDLSIFSPDDIHHAPAHYARLDRGGRGVEGFCRPRVLAAAGRPTTQSFDAETGVFELVVDSAPDIGAVAPTEVYVPNLHYPEGATIEASAGSAVHDDLTQRLTWSHADVVGPVTLRITPI